MHRVHQHLIFWTSHILVCSAPSFLIAYDIGYDSPGSIAAMCAGVLIFIALYTTVSSSKQFQRVDRRSILFRSIRCGTYLRSGISLVALLAMIVGFFSKAPPDFLSIFIFPDFYAGTLSVTFVEDVLGGLRAFGEKHAFGPTLATVLVEGVIISLSLLIICSVCALVLGTISHFRRTSR